MSSRKSRSPRKQTSWNKHVMNVYRAGQKKNKDFTLKDAMKSASKSYRKSLSKSPKKTSRKSPKKTSRKTKKSPKKSSRKSPKKTSHKTRMYNTNKLEDEDDEDEYDD